MSKKLLSTVGTSTKLETLHGENGKFYYKRNFSTYNLTLSVLTSQDTYCYVWDQTVAGRGSNEVASCLKKYLNDHVKGTAIEEVTFICDNCSSQNKNRMQNEMISVSVIEIPNLKAMSFVFQEKGHTMKMIQHIHA